MGILEFQCIYTALITIMQALYLSSSGKQLPSMVCHHAFVLIEVVKMFLCTSLITHSEGQIGVR